MLSALKKIFGSANDRIIKSFSNNIEKINSLELHYNQMTDQQLYDQTSYFRSLLSQGKTLDDILCDAFATVREASKRTIGLRHFDVQLIGGMVLNKGMISEMRTGEGKTLVATLACYLNAIEGKGVHIVTVNDYLAERDSNWMGQIYKSLGMSVGCIVHNLSDHERKEAYNCDITYGTNNEFGFDYLRDNMKFSYEQLVQRPFNFAIIDEVDSILVDEARTPLIISGPTENNSDLYLKMNKIVKDLIPEDYDIDEKTRSVILSEIGIERIEDLLRDNNILSKDANLYDLSNIFMIHYVNQALRAQKIYIRDVDYMVKDSKVIIIDEFTGRMMEGRRYSNGLHQALEAKENVIIQNENQTLASITFQNYFRLYPKLSGMTGTAMTEANEFREIYNLEVICIPTHNKISRIDEDDQIYKSAAEKYKAILKIIEEHHKIGQPILVGTTSIEKSEYISSMLKKKNILHNVLNAKYHEQEASIIAQAGRFGAVTIATNMAGRGTDIMLGGNASMLIAKQCINLESEQLEQKIHQINKQVEEEKQKVIQAGGLLVIGTERHESRRIDNQLRGRSGRQGDPGKTIFYLSLEDDLMRIFASDGMAGWLIKLGLKEDEAIIHPWISKALEKAQQKVEGFNYDMRKNVLKYDNVDNEQRKIIYEQRHEILKSQDVSDISRDMYTQVVTDLISSHFKDDSYSDTWDVVALENDLHRIFATQLNLAIQIQDQNFMKEGLENFITIEIDKLFNNKEKQFGSEIMRSIEKEFLLITLDQLWRDHIHLLDESRQGMNLRAYGQKDPLNEYKRESFYLFDDMLSEIRIKYTEKIFHVEVGSNNLNNDFMIKDYLEHKRKFEEDRLSEANLIINNKIIDRDNIYTKVGRNELCPCGSTKKFKHCHGEYQ